MNPYLKAVKSLFTPAKQKKRKGWRYVFNPHQGERERSRRLRQIAFGKLNGGKENPKFITSSVRNAAYDFVIAEAKKAA